MSDKMVAIQQADGFLVTYAAGEQRQHELCDDLQEARAAYSEPPMGWRSIGISACRDGVPFAQLDVPRIQIVRPLARALVVYAGFSAADAIDLTQT